MNVLIIILIIILFLYFLINYIYKRFINTLKLKRLFNNNISLVLCGSRGKGKDVTFSYLCYNTEHNSNIKMQYNTNIITVDMLGIENLNRSSLINSNFKPILRSKYEFFDNPTYISDSGLFFPNYDDSYLNSQYSNIALTWSIWRHLYDAPCHFNIQKCGRLWKKLREQIENVVEIQNIHILPFHFKITYRFYERLNDCELGLKPLKFKNGLFRKNENIKIENSKRGDIFEFTCLIPKRCVNHDTKIFRKMIFIDYEKNEK